MESENSDGKNFWAQEGQNNQRLVNYIIGSFITDTIHEVLLL